VRPVGSSTFINYHPSLEFGTTNSRPYCLRNNIRRIQCRAGACSRHVYPMTNMNYNSIYLLPLAQEPMPRTGEVVLEEDEVSGQLSKTLPPLLAGEVAVRPVGSSTFINYHPSLEFGTTNSRPYCLRKNICRIQCRAGACSRRFSTVFRSQHESNTRIIYRP